MSNDIDELLERVRSVTASEYAIEGELGRGGMATVYLARDLRLKRRDALKVMSPALGKVPEVQTRFVVEARTAAHLDHPNIITVYSVKEVEGLLFIVMKFVDGRTIEDVLPRDEEALARRSWKPVDIDIATTVVGKVAEALHYAHGEGIVHRDIKPSNIMIDTRGRTIVTDFGIAKVTQSAASGILSTLPGNATPTLPGAVLGTAAYMSPEQCRGLVAGPASDQYSLGVTAYELLSGRPPFKGGVLSLIDAHKSVPPPPLSEFAAGIDQGLVETVMRMLAKDPEDRWDSMEVVSERMARHAADAGDISSVRKRIAALASQGAGNRWTKSGDIEATTPSPNLIVTPAEPSVQVGETAQLELSDPGGDSLGDFSVEWKSEDVQVATVDDAGKVFGQRPGVAKITARTGRGVGRATVTVTPSRVDTIVLSPRSPSLETGKDVQLVATALDAYGNVVPDSEFAWSSSDQKICSVSQGGHAVARSSGRVEIVAECEGARGAMKIAVLPAGRTTRLAPADPRRASGAGLAGLSDDRPTVIAPTGRATTDEQAAEEEVAEETHVGATVVGPPVVDPERWEWTRERKRTAALVGLIFLVAVGGGAWLATRPGNPAAGTSNAPAGGAAGQTAGDLNQREGIPGGATSTDSESAPDAGTASDTAGIAGGGPAVGNPTDSTTATDFVATVPADRPSVDTNATPLVTPEPPPSDGASDDIERSPDTLAPAANIDVEPDAAPDATASGDADSTGADITLQIAELPDTAIAGRPGPAPLAGGSDSLPQVVVEPSGAVGDTSAALDSDDVVGRTADIDEPAPDPLLCSDPATPGTVLSSLLLSDPLGRVEELYQPTDADDERTKTELMEVLESAQRLRASTRAVRNEATSSGCNWVMQVDFAWTNAFGQPRGRSVEFRLELVNDGGAARVERIFDASPP